MNSICKLNCIIISKENCKSTNQILYAIYETETKVRIKCHVKNVSVKEKNNDTVSHQFISQFAFIRKPMLVIANCFIKFQSEILLSYLIHSKHLKGLSNEGSRYISRLLFLNDFGNIQFQQAILALTGSNLLHCRICYIFIALCWQ